MSIPQIPWLPSASPAAAPAVFERGGDFAACADPSERKRIEIALDALARRYAQLSGVAFYQAVCRHLVETLDLGSVFVGALSTGGDRIDVQAGWSRSGALAPWSYALEGTPCAEVIQGGPRLYPTGGADTFSPHKALRDRQIEAYCGTPLLDKHGRAIGLIVALSSGPLIDAHDVNTLLDVFDDRVSAEMQREAAEAALNRRIAVEGLIARLSTELILVAPDALDSALDRALRLVGEFAGVERASVCQMARNSGQVDNTHEWCAAGIPPQRLVLQGIRFDDDFMASRLIRTHSLAVMDDVRALPADEWPEREWLCEAGFRSILMAPMVSDTRLIGFVSLSMTTAPRRWSDEDRILVRLVSNAVSSLLERKRAEDGRRLAASVFTNANEAIMITDPQGAIIDVNAAFTRITGYPRDEVLGRTPHLLSSGHHDKHFYAELWRALSEDGQWQGEIWNRRRNGDDYVEWLTISALRDEHGEISHYLALFSDISAQKAHQSQLEYIAHFDALTGLPNRVLLHDRLERAMAQARRSGRLVVAAYIDLDGFKAVNDRHGHQMGDQLLAELAMRMRTTLREGDSVSRLGGDEFFAVLVELPDPTACLQLVQRLLGVLAQRVPLGGVELQVSASIGLAFYPQGEEVDADQLLRQADLAMYQAKLTGKNRFHVFDAVQDRSVRGQHQTLVRIEQGLERGEFVLHYQPKVNMRSGQLIGAEALIRWQHPEEGLVGPAAFLPVIENHPLAIRLGEWVIGSALAQVAAWQGEGLRVPVSVNIGAHHLQVADFMPRLCRLLAARPEVPPAMLELEVLESSALESLQQASRVIEACAEIGVSFALDDFGTGYSSLAYLKRLPAACLKIDQMFVRDMLHDSEDRAILQAIIGLASAFRRKVIAEGVETIEQGALLLELGCETAQGFYISRPLPAADLPGWAAGWLPPEDWRSVPRA
ncbi:putative bifunctional diguanylate cyclase/phosphodiesterase [Thauera linaloolentis]|uniref:PAS/PAC and GAF sensor-containing diguanylate cyclase/phosphodiesterase n=1 Tax=Thauera linaloolentis (strain DSM 12138 / JCM 21573 / CCUG 41526 / CIP 105981 / IAM 15112 / NBRC 102519 / 47Lol) TaxID=1123367 RepID=N6Z5B5_THAL4|nr:EAL domain-containing protein [Thauera linaloolentis]ENO89618.1 PAS/PAC and GAF sensor-containing diguanylate cyclase/phosphodiesterase [Thauera linaloolentis 47Lol = DSM 12138]MCM8565936.1 EAL domain-containing protein [Thauera linaloolentis]